MMKRCKDRLDLGRGFYALCHKEADHGGEHRGGKGATMTWPVVKQEKP
jgi:hypothetical protein